MKWALAAAALLAVAALYWGSARPARACSPAPLESLVERADVIAEGRFTRWEVATDVAPPTWGTTPIRVHLAVGRTFKGTMLREISFVDTLSFSRRDGKDTWERLTMCPSPLPGDPTGKSAIVIITTDKSDGLPRASAFYYGDSLSGDEYQRARSMLVAALPPGGGAPGGTEGLPMFAVALIVAGSILVLLGAVPFVFPAKGSRA